jgi:hypothetical protein
MAHCLYRVFFFLGGRGVMIEIFCNWILVMVAQLFK